MSSKLKQIDRELLLKNENFDYNNPENAYFGGYFGDTEGDYVEVLIYDTNDNLLETSVADSSDYYYDSEKGGMKLKTGTILRKLGYDRGRFKVTYNFLRKTAGSYETLVTDKNDEIVNGNIDINEIDKSLFIKENKYIAHEISPSRNEIRLVTQNIKDEKYVRDFYRLASKSKKVIAETEAISNIQFEEGDGDSSTLIFSNSDTAIFEQAMKGGVLSIPNFFLVGRQYPPPLITADDVGLTPTEITTGELQASFYMDLGSGEFGTKENNNGNEPGDVFFAAAYDRFRETVDGEDIENQDGMQFEGDGRTTRDVKNLDDTTFDCVLLKHNNPEPVIEFVSNSSFPSDSPTLYTWEIFGWDEDRDTNWKGQTEKTFNQLQSRGIGEDSGGNFRIMTPDSTYATVTANTAFKATQTINGGQGADRAASRLRVELFGKNLKIGIKLTILDNTSLQESTLMLPAIIETSS